MNWWVEITKSLYNSKLYWTLSILASGITRFISISTFASLLGIPLGIKSSVTRLRMYEIDAGLQKSIIKRKSKSK